MYLQLALTRRVLYRKRPTFSTFNAVYIAHCQWPLELSTFIHQQLRLEMNHSLAVFTAKLAKLQFQFKDATLYIQFDYRFVL